MRFDIKTIARMSGAAMEIETATEPDAIGLTFPGFTFDRSDPVRFQGTIQNAGHGLLVLSGTASIVYNTTCARCLAPVRRDLSVGIRETFRSNRPIPGERMQESDPEEADDFYGYDDYTVDITDAIRENLLPALPIRELCKPDCAGICPVCGADLNKGSCGCPSDPSGENNPFGRLKDLL